MSPRSLFRRIVRLAVAASGLLVAAALWAPEVDTNHVAVSRNITDYVLFAYDTLEFKGQNACPACGQILGGHVGANAIAGNNPTLSMGGGGSGHKVFMGDDTQVVGDSVRIGNTSSVFQLYANKVQSGFNAAAVVRHGGPAPFAPQGAAPNQGAIIDPALLPPDPVCTPGSTAVTAQSGTELPLAPGSYGDVTVRDDGILRLQNGTYEFASLKLGKRATLLTEPGTLVRIESEFSINNDGFIGPSDFARFEICSVGVGKKSASLNLSRQTEFHGQVFAPDGRVNLGHTTNLFGRFWALAFSSDFNVNLNFVPPEEECEVDCEPPPPLPEEECVTCERDTEGEPVELVVDQDVRVIITNSSSSCTGDADLCSTLSVDRSGGSSPDKWKAVFDIGGKKLVVKAGATIDTGPFTSFISRPGIEIRTTCEIQIDYLGSIDIGTKFGNNGNILLAADGDIQIDGHVRNRTRDSGVPGDITLATCCGNITVGRRGIVETDASNWGNDVVQGGSDVNLVACCEVGGDILVDGLVIAQANAVPPGTLRPDVNVFSSAGTVTINGNTATPIRDNYSPDQGGGGRKFDLFGGLLSWVTHDFLAGTVKVQARGDIIVRGHGPGNGPGPTYGAIAAGSIAHPTDTQRPAAGTIDVRSLEGRVIAENRAFELIGRDNDGVALRVQSRQGMTITNSGGPTFNPVVDAAGSFRGGDNLLQSFAAGITVGPGATVVSSSGGSNNLTSCTGVTYNAGAVTPAENTSDNAGVCGPGPEPLFIDCSQFLPFEFDPPQP